MPNAKSSLSNDNNIMIISLENNNVSSYHRISKPTSKAFGTSDADNINDKYCLLQGRVC